MLSVLLLGSILAVGTILLAAYVLTIQEQRRATSPVRLPQRSVLTLLALAVMALAIWWLLHPVCVPLSDADVREFARWAPIETRADRQLHGPVFQRRDGRWYQCKSWLSRQFFF